MHSATFWTIGLKEIVIKQVQTKSETSLNQDLIVFPIVNVSDITWLDFFKKICLFMHVVNNETQIATITKELIASRVSKKKRD